MKLGQDWVSRTTNASGDEVAVNGPAAPVPCAASPADKYYEDADSLIATVTTYCNHGRDEEAKQLIVSWLATLIEQDRIERERAAVYQRACVCGHDLGDHGFGIDFALECCNCDCRKFARATGEGARDGSNCVQRDLSARPDSGAADVPLPDGGSVAVSLDPHRWIHARIDDLKDSAIAGFKNHDARLIADRQMLLREVKELRRQIQPPVPPEET